MLNIKEQGFVKIELSLCDGIPCILFSCNNLMLHGILMGTLLMNNSLFCWSWISRRWTELVLEL